MPTLPESVTLAYLVAPDGQTARVGVEYASPIDGTAQQQTVEITEPELLADIDALLAKIATTKGLLRTQTSEPTNG